MPARGSARSLRAFDAGIERVGSLLAAVVCVEEEPGVLRADAPLLSVNSAIGTANLIIVMVIIVADNIFVRTANMNDLCHDNE